MMKILFLINVLIVIATFLELIHMVMFQKIWLVLPDGTTPNSFKAGTYNIAVFGRVWYDTIRESDVHVETTSGIMTNIKFHSISSTGMSNFRTFTRFAKFQLDAPAKLKVLVANINITDIKPSRLLLKRLLFRQHIKAVEIIITPKFNYTKFFLLIILNVGSFFLLLLQ